MYALIVRAAFENYKIGDLIEDPNTIAAIEAGPYANFVSQIVLPGGGTGPGLSCYVTLAVAGQPIVMQGGAFNYVPTALDFSIDSGASWGLVQNFAEFGGEWTGTGPAYSAAQSTAILVRDHNTQSVVAPAAHFTVTNPPMTVVMDAVTTGSVTTLPPGASATATATISGGGTLALTFGLPQGQPGSTTSGSTFTLQAYGASAGNGSTGPDCTAALVAAIAAAQAVGQEVLITGGDWWFHSAVSVSSGALAIRGQGKGVTRLHFTHSGTGISYAPGSVLSHISIRDLSMWAENGAGPTACAIAVTYPSVSSYGNVTTTISGVEITGYPNSGNGLSPFPQTWTRGIVLANAWSAELADCSWFGPPAAAGATGAAWLEVNGANDTRVTDVQAYFGASLIVQSGYLQGLRLTNPLVVDLDYVLTQTAQTGWTGYSAGAYSIQGLAILGGELNCRLGHLNVAAMLGGFCTGASITRHQGGSSAQVLFDLTDCSNFHITGCDWNGGPGLSDIAVQFQLGVLGNGSGNSISGGHFANLATAISVVGTNGCVGSAFSGFRCSNVTTPVVNQSTAANGNLFYYPGPAGASFPSGLTSPFDFRWASSDNSTLFRVQSSTGGANFLKTIAGVTAEPPTLLFTGSDATVAGSVQTTGGNLYLSAAGDGSSGGLAKFYNTPGGSSSCVTFTNAIGGSPVSVGTNADGLIIAPVGALSLGGSEVFSSTIGASGSNPGGGANTNQLWSNAGVVCASLSSGALPGPAYRTVTIGGAQAAISWPTLAALRATAYGALADGAVAVSAGRTASGDGGGGQFVWNAASTTTDDGVLVVNPNGNSGAGRFLRLLGARHSVNVLWAGAVGDGVTDDTSAFAMARAAANAAGLPMYVPGGKSFKLNWAISDTADLWMVGEGKIIWVSATTPLSVIREPGLAIPVSGLGTILLGTVSGNSFTDEAVTTWVLQGVASASLPSVSAGQIYSLNSQDYYPWASVASGGTNNIWQGQIVRVQGICIPFNTGTGGFAEDQIVVGGTSGATAQIRAVSGTSSGYIVVSSLSAAFAAGESLTVAGATLGICSGAAVVAIAEKIVDTYVTLPQIQLLPVCKTIIEGVTFDVPAGANVEAPIGTANRLPGLILANCVEPLVRNVTCKSGWTRFLQSLGNWRLRATGVRISYLPDDANLSEGAYGYGIELGGPDTGALVDGLIATGCRHGFTTNVYWGGYSFMPLQLRGNPRDFLVTGGTGRDCYNAAFDTHWGCYGGRFVDCRSDSNNHTNRNVSASIGFQNRGFNTTYSGCYAYKCVNGFVDSSTNLPSPVPPAGQPSYISIISYGDCQAVDFQLNGFLAAVADVTGGNRMELRNCKARGDGLAVGAPYNQTCFNFQTSNYVRLISCGAERFNANCYQFAAGGRIEVLDCWSYYRDNPNATGGMRLNGVPTEFYISNYRVFSNVTSSTPAGLIRNASGSSITIGLSGAITCVNVPTTPLVDPTSTGALAFTWGTSNADTLAVNSVMAFAAAGVIATGLPTSNPGAGSGKLWNNGGVVSIA